MTPSAQSAGTPHQGQVSSTPSALSAGNPQQGQVPSTPSAQTEVVDLWRNYHPSTAAQDSLIELGSSFERGSASTPQVSQNRVSPPTELGSVSSSQVTQNSVSPPIELGSVSSVQGPQVGPVATQNSVFPPNFQILAAQASDHSNVSVAPTELSFSAPAEETSSCIYRDYRLNLALMAGELDAPQ